MRARRPAPGVSSCNSRKSICREGEMTRRVFARVGGAAIGIIFGGTLLFSQTQPPIEGPAAGGSPAWFLQGSFPDPGGRTIVEPGGKVTIPGREGGAGGAAGGRGAGRGAARGGGAPGAPAAAATPGTVAPAAAGTPGCSHSPLCGRRGGIGRQSLQRVQWKQTLGYTFTYPYTLPPGFGGVPAVALDSKGNLWVFQRAASRKPAAVQVRSEPQAHPSGRPGRHRLPGQGARHGRRCRGQRLDLRRERRHRDEAQPRGQAAHDHRRQRDAGATGTKPRDSGCCGSR